MKLTWRTCLKVGVSVFVVYLAIRYWNTAANLVLAILGAAMPLVIGGCIAYLVNILMANYERHYFPRTTKNALIKSRRPVCLTLAFLTLIAIIALIFWIVIPQLMDAVQVIAAVIPDYMTKLIAIVSEWGIFSQETLKALEAIDWKSQVGKLLEVISSGIGGAVNILITAVSSVFSVVVTAFLSIIFSIYLLSSKERLGAQSKRILHRYLPDRVNEAIAYVLGILDDCFHRYIVGQCTEAVILGGLCTLGMWILRLPYAPMIGALVAFTALIPIAGAYIGAGVGAFMILTVDPFKALIFLIFLVILQQLEGNLIYPRVVGSSMGLPGIWVLAAVTVGGGIMGIPGMLLGVPLAAAAYRIVGADVRRRERLEAAAQTEQQKE